jgi:hypothetical protein
LRSGNGDGELGIEISVAVVGEMGDGGGMKDVNETKARVLGVVLAGVGGVVVSGCGVGGGMTPMGAVVPSIYSRMRPQQYTWHPERATAGPVLVFVSIPRQEAVVYRNGVRIGRAAVSTGKEGHATPTGVFQILEKDVDHHSKTYGNAPMPYMERLTWDGVALHAGFNPGHPASHGCVRMPEPFARELYGVTKRGGTVIISKSAKLPTMTVGVAGGGGGGGSPGAIVMSTATRNVVVYQNGKETGRSSLTVSGGMERFRGESVFLYGSDGAWHRVEGGGRVEDVRAMMVPPASFAGKMRSVIRPGTTMVVTSEPLVTGGGGTSRELLGSR